ncbi:hypothetical protein [Vibrio profundi]|uniref:hypothetical protein n=1 Tax=Vibrio profundi TaxID=1774960 RepID=UPI0037358EFC
MKYIYLLIYLVIFAILFSLVVYSNSAESAEEGGKALPQATSGNVVYGPIKGITSGSQGLLIRLSDQEPDDCPHKRSSPWLVVEQKDHVMVNTAYLAWVFGLNVHVYISDKDTDTYYCRVTQIAPDSL